jgi:cyanophycin synthetase
MKILERKVYRGPNYYSYKPVIRLTLDLEELEAYPSSQLPGFNPALLETIPTLHEHGCSYGAPGGFVRRLEEGTWMGHVLEHVAIELQCLAGTPVTYGKTRGAGETGVYYVVYSFQQEEVGLEAGRLAERLLRSLLPDDLPSALPAAERATFNFTLELEDLAGLADRVALGPSTGSLVKAAEARDIPWIRLNEGSLIQFGHGKYQRRIQATVTSETRHIAVDIAQDKELTARLLDDVGIPVPRQRVVRDEDAAAAASHDIGFPVVVKPLDASHGRGVSLNLQSEAEVRLAFQKAQEHRSYVIIEKFIPGHDYRVLVVNGQAVAVAERVPGHVVGDGVHTVQELIDIVNRDPRRGVGHEKVLTRLLVDHQALRLLEQAGLTLESVLAAGRVLYLRSTGNLSTGGTAIDRTDDICYENKEIAIRAAQVVGLDVAGIDFITPDIARPIAEVGGGIVEVNAAPGFRMHVAPSEGAPRDVAGPVMDMLFPPGAPSRIPMAAITGTNGKTTTSRMVAHILKMSGYHVGLTTTDGIYIDGERYLSGDMTGPWSARVVLKHPLVDAAVLETARGGILREGLGYDKVDVGAVLNVAGDHLGLKGVETLEDLAAVKALVVEVVKEGGYAVLNADDPLTAAMAARCDGDPFYFTFDPRNPVVQEHVRKGGRALVLEDGLNGKMLTLYERHQHIPLLWAHLIPATLEGLARFNVANALAAAAIARALGVKVENIRQGLRTFDSSHFQVPGRLNVYDQHPFRVIVDYGHNPPAVQAVADLVHALPREGRAIGVVSAPGDRRNQDIQAIGEIAGSTFDLLFCREDHSRRGRAAGEVAGLIHRAAAAAGLPDARIAEVWDETDAIAAALATAQRGDLLVIFADDVQAAWKQVIYWGQGRPESPAPRDVPTFAQEPFAASAASETLLGEAPAPETRVRSRHAPDSSDRFRLPPAERSAPITAGDVRGVGHDD